MHRTLHVHRDSPAMRDPSLTSYDSSSQSQYPGVSRCRCPAVYHTVPPVSRPCPAGVPPVSRPCPAGVPPVSQVPRVLRLVAFLQLLRMVFRTGLLQLTILLGAAGQGLTVLWCVRTPWSFAFAFWNIVEEAFVIFAVSDCCQQILSWISAHRCVALQKAEGAEHQD